MRGVDNSLWGYLIPALIVAIVAYGLFRGLSLDFDRTGNQFDPQVFPVDAVDANKGQLPEGNVFNYFPWGGYLLHRLWPAQLVFIDGQTDFYGEDLTREYEQVITLQDGWRDVLEKYNVDWVFMPSNSILVEYLLSESGWKIYYLDEVAAIITR